MLFNHVRGFEQRPGVHELPMQGQAFAFKQGNVQRLGVVDQGQFALGCQCLDQLRQVLIGLGQAGDVSHGVDACLLQGFAQGLTMIDDRMGAQFAHPRLGLWTRGAADDLEPGKLTGQLCQD